MAALPDSNSNADGILYHSYFYGSLYHSGLSISIQKYHAREKAAALVALAHSNSNADPSLLFSEVVPWKLYRS